MSDATLWIDDTNGTAAVKNGSAIYTMPLWVFEDMRDIIMVEAEKKAEVTYHDFDTQQELLDRYRAENRKLRGLVRDMWKPFCWAQSGYEVCLTHEQDVAIRNRVRELRVEVDG